MPQQPARSRKSGRPPIEKATAPRVARRRRTATAALDRGSMLVQSGRGRTVEPRLAPPRQAERRRAKPGAGIKRARGVMTPRSR
jgi:hypothetical protein